MAKEKVFAARVGTQAELALHSEVIVIPARMVCRKTMDGFHGRSKVLQHAERSLLSRLEKANRETFALLGS